MDFQDLRAFAHVARQGSFSRAAVSLRTAQSALSRRVLRLEHSLGVALLERHGRGVRTTQAGAVLLREADDLLERLAGIEHAMSNVTNEPTGDVRIALPPTTGQILGPALIAACRTAFPRLRLHIREGFSGAIHHWIEEGDVDLAVLYDPEPNAENMVLPLLREPLLLVAPVKVDGPAGPLDDIEAFRVRDLATLPLILPSRSHSICALIERYAIEHGFRLNIVNQVDGIRTTKGLVEAGLGYTVFSYAGVYEEVLAGTLRTIPLKPRLHWTLAVAHKLSAASAPIEEIKRLIVEQVDAMLARGFWRGQPLNS